MEHIRKEFPALRQNIYTNTAVYGPLYDALLDWRQNHDLDFLLKASEMRGKSLETIADTRTAVGEFFGCKRENVALVTNFSSGLNMLLEGMDVKQKVLMLENDYPSVNWPFESRDFETVFVKIDENLEERIRKVVKKEAISVLALSVVQWQNGIKIDLGFLKDLKKENQDLIIIADGTQFCGTANLNFEDSGIDILGASGYKWLLAGYGNGFVLIKEAIKDRFSLKTIGFSATNVNPSKKNTLRFAKRFEPGHLSCLNFGSLKFSLDFLAGIGKDKIEAQNEVLSQKAKKEFSELGLLKDNVALRKGHSTIFNIKGDDKLFEQLSNNNIICSQRGSGIRLSFHFYNTEKEIDTIVGILKKHH